MLTIETDLPIGISIPDETQPNPDSNLYVIRSLNLLALGNRCDPGDSALLEGNYDLARLEAKVDMLLAMVSSLVAEKSLLPPTRSVRFSAEALTVSVEESFAINQVVLVTLYPHPDLPHPLVFKATVTAANAAGVDPAGQLELTLEHPDPSVRDEFERYIFLRHRREHAANSPK